MLLSETLHVERTIANEIAEGNIIYNSKLSIVSTLEAIPKPDSAEVCLIHDCSRPLGYTRLRAAPRKYQLDVEIVKK